MNFFIQTIPAVSGVVTQPDGLRMFPLFVYGTAATDIGQFDAFTFADNFLTPPNNVLFLLCAYLLTSQIVDTRWWSSDQCSSLPVGDLLKEYELAHQSYVDGATCIVFPDTVNLP